MKQFRLFLLCILFSMLHNLNAQVDNGDCPGNGYDALTETHYYWYWNGYLGAGTEIYNSSGKMDQEDAEDLVEQHIQSCFIKFLN